MVQKSKFNKPNVKKGKGANIDLSVNPKQAKFFITSLAAAQEKNLYKFLSYGGAIRGGKTFVTLAILIRLCEIFPGSRWHIIRKDFPVLEATTIPSFEKLIAGSHNWRFFRNKSNYYAYNRKGSKIFFKGENKSQDPTLMKFLGLETNGFFLELANYTAGRNSQFVPFLLSTNIHCLQKNSKPRDALQVERCRLY